MSESWLAVPMWTVAQEVRSTIDPADIDGDVFHYSIPVVDETGTGRIEPSTGSASQKLLLDGGEVLISKLNPRKGRVLISKQHELPILASPEFIALRVIGAVDRFLAYWLASEATRRHLDARVQSVTRSHQRVTPELVRHLHIALPCAEEQRRIADFLDAETALLDDLKNKVEEAVVLSSERLRGSLDCEFDVFAAEQVRLKFLLSEPLRYGASLSAEHDDRNWPRYIRITDIDAEGRLRDESFKSLDPDEARPYMLTDRDVLLARSGATVGKSFLYRNDAGPACFAGYLIRARCPKDTLLPELLINFTSTRRYWRQISSDAIQATIQNVSAERYGNVLVPRVPAEAQVSLVSKLDRLNAAHRQFATLARQQLKLLAERRQALITAAVTGQIDVTTARGVDV